MTLFIVAAVCLSLLVTQHLMHRSSRKAAAARWALDAKELAEHTLKHGTRLFAEEVAGLQVSLADAIAISQEEITKRHQAETATGEERAKVQRYFETVQQTEREKMVWRKLYYDQSLAHGNAQQLMMGLIEQAGRRLAAHGVYLKVPAVIQSVREEFREQHEMPAREAMALIQQAQKDQESKGLAATPGT